LEPSISQSLSKEERETLIESHHFSLPTFHNYIEVLIDGMETFQRYYEVSFYFHSLSSSFQNIPK
jgi:hypothetical protein